MTAAAAAGISVLFCVWLRGSVHYQFVVAWVLSDLIVPEPGNRYPPCYTHIS